MPIVRRFRPGPGLRYWRIDLLPRMGDSRIIGPTDQDRFPWVPSPHQIGPFQIGNKDPVIHHSHEGDPQRKVLEIPPLVRPHEGHEGGGPDFIVPRDVMYFLNILYLILRYHCCVINLFRIKECIESALPDQIIFPLVM